MNLTDYADMIARDELVSRPIRVEVSPQALIAHFPDPDASHAFEFCVHFSIDELAQARLGDADLMTVSAGTTRVIGHLSEPTEEQQAAINALADSLHKSHGIFL